MILGALQPTAAHHAALTLHALAGPDRQWVLDALSGEHQATLRPLLHELEELGIPREGELARALAPDDLDKQRNGAGALLCLDAAGVGRLAAILCAEPPRVAAALLASRNGPWRGELMAKLPPAFLHRMESIAPAGGAAGALQAAVVAELAPLLRERPAESPRASVWHAMWRKLDALRSRR